MKRKIVSLGLSALLVLTLFGCSSKSNDEKPSSSPSTTPSASPSATPSDNTAAEETTLTGKVTSVEGSKIVIELLENASSADVNNSTADQQFAGREAQTTGTKPSVDTKPATDSSAPATVPSGKPAGSPSADLQETEQPDSGVLQSNGESKTITVLDSSEIYIEKNGSLSAGQITDIAVGDIITVTMKGETVTSITVLNSGSDAGQTDSDSTDNADTNGSASNSGSSGASVKPGAAPSESSANPAAAGVRPAPAA
jgi:hypothetical protein